MPAAPNPSKVIPPGDRPLVQPQVRRKEVARRLRRMLELEHHPRIQMTLLLIITGALAFLASNLLRLAGMDHMGRRYLLTSLIAYFIYLGLLWLWLKASATNQNWLSDGVDVPDIASNVPLRLDGAGGGSDLIDPVGDVASSADDGVLPCLVVAVILLILCASAWVIYAAPTLFAELLIDGVMVSGLCYRFPPGDRQHWITTVLQHTALPFSITALAVWLGGCAMAHWYPRATTIGDVLFR